MREQRDAALGAVNARTRASSVVISITGRRASTEASAARTARLAFAAGPSARTSTLVEVLVGLRGQEVGRVGNRTAQVVVVGIGDDTRRSRRHRVRSRIAGRPVLPDRVAVREEPAGHRLVDDRRVAAWCVGRAEQAAPHERQADGLEIVLRHDVFLYFGSRTRSGPEALDRETARARATAQGTMQGEACPPDARRRFEPIDDRPVQGRQPLGRVPGGSWIDPRDDHALVVVPDLHPRELLQRSREQCGYAQQQHRESELPDHEEPAPWESRAVPRAQDAAAVRVQRLGRVDP